MKHLALFLSFLLVLGCKSKTEQIVSEDANRDKESEIIIAEDIESIKYTDYILSPEAKEAVINWQRYQELMMQIEYLKRADFSFFGGKNEILTTFAKDLRNDMPQKVTSPAINERLIALETKLFKLHSNLKLSNSKKSEILGNIKELLVAISNLHLQINKKFELESQVIEDPSVNTTTID